MPVIKSLKAAIEALHRNPILFAIGAISAFIGASQTAATYTNISILPGVLDLLSFLIVPFIVAGAIGMAFEGLNDITTLDRFVSTGKESYLSVLAGTLLELVILFVILFVEGLFVTVVSFALIRPIPDIGPTTQPSEVIGAIGTETLLLLAGIVIVLSIIPLGIMFLIQFFAPAIVVDDVGVIEGFKRSYNTVKNNLLSTLGYSIIAVGVGLLGSLPSFIITYAMRDNSMTTMEFWSQSLVTQDTLTFTAILLVSFIGTMIVFPLQKTFATAYYVQHSD